MTNTYVSTSVDHLSTSHLSPSLDDAYVNLVSHEDALDRSSSSCGISSSIPPIFHSDEDIMEVMTTFDYPWDDMHHRAYFLLQQIHDQYAMESKEFIHGEVDWFRHPILALYAFEDGSMANISHTIKINIFDKIGIEENITLGASAPQNKLRLTPISSNNFMMFSPSPTQRCPNLIPPLLNTISTHFLMPLLSVRS